MRLIASCKSWIETSDLTFTPAEWCASLKTAFYDPDLNELKVHGYLYVKDRSIQISPSPLSSKIEIDDIVKVTNVFLLHKAFDLDQIKLIQKCFSAMLFSHACNTKKTLYKLFIHFFSPLIRLFQGNQIIKTSNLLVQQYQTLRTNIEEFEKINSLKQLIRKKLAVLKKYRERYPNEQLFDKIAYYEAANSMQDVGELSQLVQQLDNEFKTFQMERQQLLKNARDSNLANMDRNEIDIKLVAEEVLNRTSKTMHEA